MHRARTAPGRERLLRRGPDHSFTMDTSARAIGETSPVNMPTLPHDAHDKATQIAKVFRGAVVRKAIHRHLGRAVGVPDLARAKAHMRSLLPHDQDGRLLPLSCPIECFQVFGPGVYAYMRWTVLMKRVFFVAFLFSVSNMVHNMYGGELGEGISWLSMPTIGNAKGLNSAYGAAEIMILSVLLWGMFAARRIVRKEEELLKPLATPGEHTIMLAGFPTHPPPQRDALMRAMSTYGDVTHAVVSRPIRNVLLRMPQRAKLLQALQTERIQLFLHGRSRPPGHTASQAAPHTSPGVEMVNEGGILVARATAAATAATAAAAAGRQAPTALRGHEQRRAALLARVEAAATQVRTHDDESLAMLRQVAADIGTAGSDSEYATVPTPCGPAQIFEDPGRRGGVAFVTFRDPQSAADAIRAIHETQRFGGVPGDMFVGPNEMTTKSSAESAEGGAEQVAGLPPVPAQAASPSEMGGRIPLRARRAPEPSDVMWENLHVGPRERFYRHFLSTACMLLVACVGTAIITAVMYLNGTGITKTLVSMPPGFAGLVGSIGLNLALSLPIILGNVMLFFTVPQLAERYERHTTFAGKELAIMLKLTFFQVLNTVVAAFFFLVDPTVARSPRQWYSLGGALLENVMIGDCIFIQILLDFVQIPVLVNRLCIAPHASTQQAMDQAYAMPAGIYLAFRLQLAGKFVILATVFGSAIPVLYLVATLYFWLAGWIDRYNLLRRLTPPPVTDATLVSAVAMIVFPIAIALHVVMALFFFFSIASISADEAAASMMPSPAPLVPPFLPPGLPPSPPVMPPLPFSPQFANASHYPPLPPSAWMNATPPAPASPVSPGGGGGAWTPSEDREMWAAFNMQKWTSAVAAGCLLFFFARELARYYGLHFRILSDAQARVVLKVITQEPDRDQEGLVSSTAPLNAHRSDVYLPPLAPPLLAEVDLSASARRAAKLSVLDLEMAAAQRAATGRSPDVAAVDGSKGLGARQLSLGRDVEVAQLGFSRATPGSPSPRGPRPSLGGAGRAHSLPRYLGATPGSEVELHDSGNALTPACSVNPDRT